MKRALTYIATITTATVAAAVAYRRGYQDATATQDEIMEKRREMLTNHRQMQMNGLEMQLRAREAMDDATDGIDDSVREQARRTGADPARLQEAIDSFVTEQYDGK